MKKKLKLKAFQHISFEVLNNGKPLPKLGVAVYLDDTRDPFHEVEMTLDLALERLIETRTLEDDAVRDEDRKVLLSQFDSILEIVQAKRAKVKTLPKFNDSPNLDIKPKKKS